MNLSEDRKKMLRAEYMARINRVIDYIEQHLGDELSLEMLSMVACLSRFHFHRIFAGVTGETLNHFIRRLRTEKAASQLIANPKKSITEVAARLRVFRFRRLCPDIQRDLRRERQRLAADGSRAPQEL